jgi:hypothetical protein
VCVRGITEGSCAFEGMPERERLRGNDQGVMGVFEGSWPRRERDVAWSPRTARPWRGRGAAWRGRGTARHRGAGAHARARVLASQGRGLAVPCAGHQHPGPVTRRGGRVSDGSGGLDERRDGLLHENWGRVALWLWLLRTAHRRR